MTWKTTNLLLRLLRFEIAVRSGGHGRLCRRLVVRRRRRHRGSATVFLLQTDRPRLAGSRVVGASGGRSGVSVGRHDVAPILRRRLRGRRDDCEPNPSGILRQ